MVKLVKETFVKIRQKAQQAYDKINVIGLSAYANIGLTKAQPAHVLYVAKKSS